MFKAVFLDYTGTMVREDDPCTQELLGMFLAHSDLDEPKRALATVWGLIKRLEWEHYRETFVSKDDMVDEILEICARDYHLTADLTRMHEIWQGIWVHAPLYDDVRPFLRRCTLPVFVVTNDDLRYIRRSLDEKELRVSGVISAEMVRANKPHPEILLEALRVAGVTAEEAVLVGDSETSDVSCAREAGITPILLDRRGTSTRTDIQVIRSLDELDL